MSAASITVKLGIASVALPAIGFVIGLAMQASIPGCHCDEGAGCAGCGQLSGFITILVLGGFVGALAALIFVLPATLVLAAILRNHVPGALAPVEAKPFVIGLIKRLLLLGLVIAAVIVGAAALLQKH